MDVWFLCQLIVPTKNLYSILPIAFSYEKPVSFSEAFRSADGACTNSHFTHCAPAIMLGFTALVSGGKSPARTECIGFFELGGDTLV
jgi:hypothetical protein